MTPSPAATATAAQRPVGLPAPAVLRAMPTDTRTRTLAACLRRDLQHRLDVPPAHRLSTDRPLRRQGVHPLLALQLQRALKRELDVETPLRLLTEGTLDELATTLSARLAGTASTGPDDTGTGTAPGGDGDAAVGDRGAPAPGDAGAAPREPVAAGPGTAVPAGAGGSP